MADIKAVCKLNWLSIARKRNKAEAEEREEDRVTTKEKKHARTKMKRLNGKGGEWCVRPNTCLIICSTQFSLNDP